MKNNPLNLTFLTYTTSMKKSFLIALGAVLLCWASPLPAQDGEDSSTPSESSTEATDHGKSKAKASSKKKKTSVLAALSELDCFNAEPNKKAKFFIYLQSASWCGPCRAEMPKIVEMYPEMRKAKVEVILLGCDQTKQAAEAYLKKFEAPFPGVMVQEGRSLPGFQESRGIPHATFVNAKGEVIKADYATTGIVAKWKEIIKEKPQKAKKEKQSTDDPSH